MVTAAPGIHQLFESDPRTVQRARRFVIETLRLNDATEASCEAFALIASELITNFVEHSPRGDYRSRPRHRARSVLGIARALCDDLTVTTSDKSLEVHCWMPR